MNEEILVFIEVELLVVVVNFFVNVEFFGKVIKGVVFVLFGWVMLKVK